MTQSAEKGLVEELLPVILAASPGTPTLTCRKIAEAVAAHLAVEKDAASECGWCGKVAVIAYTDVLGIDWCVTCYQDTYLENWPEPTRVFPPGQNT